MNVLKAAIYVVLGVAAVGPPDEKVTLKVTVPFVEANEIDISELVVRLATATGLDVARPRGDITLPMTGPAGNLGRKMLSASLGPEARIEVDGRTLVIDLGTDLTRPDRLREWEKRIRDLAREAEREARRRLRYGMHASRSYLPNNASRPTVCLVHGINSSSGGFVHMVKPIENAGYGVVVFDYPFNRSLEDNCRRFERDWQAFRRRVGETRPWALVGHSMGALVAREYVEGPSYQKDVSTLVMIAPVNQGSHIAKTQTLLQLLNGVQAVNGRRTSDALAHLGDGLGEAAADLTPGSPFLKALNARPRRPGLPYHTLAGDSGVLRLESRRQIEGQIGAARRQGGLLGGFARLAVGDDLSDRLDELSDGTGDGCVSVERTRLDGVTDHVVIHANHAELIRAPLLFAEPGPVACMPFLLDWLKPGQADNERTGH